MLLSKFPVLDEDEVPNQKRVVDFYSTRLLLFTVQEPLDSEYLYYFNLLPLAAPVTSGFSFSRKMDANPSNSPDAQDSLQTTPFWRLPDEMILHIPRYLTGDFASNGSKSPIHQGAQGSRSNDYIKNQDLRAWADCFTDYISSYPFHASLDSKAISLRPFQALFRYLP
jgi:hypothetical protein